MTRVVEENVARWLATGAFVACAGGLMWALGSSLGLWAGLAFGAVVSGLIGGRLWATHLDNVAIEQDKAHNVGKSLGGRLIADDEDELSSRRGRPGDTAGPTTWPDDDD